MITVRPHRLSRWQRSCANMVIATTLLVPPVGSIGAGAPGPNEGTDVLRVQVELSVCDLRDAGTSDPVSARLSEGEGEGDVTWLDRPGATFEQGQRYRYDLLLGGVRTLADITELVIDKPGDDDLCVGELRLLVNARPIFLRTFGAGAWLRTSRQTGFRATGAELRSNAAWQTWAWSMPEWLASTGAAITRQELVERLTSLVATAVHDLGLSWSARPGGLVIIKRGDERTVHAAALLTRDEGVWPSLAVRLDFDVRLCPAGHADATIANVETHRESRWYAAVYSQARVARDEQMLTLLRDRLVRGRPLVLAGKVCPRVDPAGNILY
jgi:hypothetical protein